MMAILYAKLRILKRNMGWILLMTIFPIVITLVFGSINQGQGKETLLLVNEDQGTYAGRFIHEIKRSKTYEVKEVGLNEAEGLLREGQALFALIIPKGFEAAIQEGKEGRLIVTRTIETLDGYGLEGVLNGAMEKILTQGQIVKVGGEILKKYGQDEAVGQRFYELVEGRLEGTKPVTIRARVLGEDQHKKVDEMTLISAGFLLFFSMYPIVFTVGDILDDKRLLIWDRLMVSPISKLKIYAANLVFASSIGLVQILVLLVLNKIIFHISWTKNRIGLLLLVGAFVFTVTGLGLLLTSFVKTHQQLSSIVPIVIVSTSMIGGLMWPIELITNKVLLALARMTPQFWAMKAMTRLITSDAPMKDILFPMLVLLLMGILFIGLGLQVKEGRESGR